MLLFLCASAFTTARLRGEQHRGSESSAIGELPLVHAAPGFARGPRPCFRETMALFHRSHRQASLRRFGACRPRGPPSRKGQHCPHRGGRPSVGLISTLSEPLTGTHLFIIVSNTSSASGTAICHRFAIRSRRDTRRCRHCRRAYFSGL